MAFYSLNIQISREIVRSHKGTDFVCRCVLTVLQQTRLIEQEETILTVRTEYFKEHSQLPEIEELNNTEYNQILKTMADRAKNIQSICSHLEFIMIGFVVIA